MHLATILDDVERTATAALGRQWTNSRSKIGILGFWASGLLCIATHVRSEQA
jgi:hypothetical protein